MNQKRRTKAIRKSRKVAYKRWIFLMLLPIIIIIFYLLPSSIKDESKNTLLIVKDSGEVRLIVFDFNLDEIYTLLFPQNVEVEVARQLGRRKIKGVWELGISEGLSGDLLTETVTNHLGLPVTLWAEGEAIDLIEGNIFAKISAVLDTFSSNLSLRDKAIIAMFATRVETGKREEISLSESDFLKKVELADGSSGFVRSSTIPQDIVVIISDPDISRQGLKVLVKDGGGNMVVTGNVVDIMEVMGTRVLSVEKSGEVDMGCSVEGLDKKIVNKFSKILACDSVVQSTGSGYDLIVSIGKKFVDEF